jgi:hypothetical protein
VGASGLGVPQGSLFLSLDRHRVSLCRINPATGAPLITIPLSGGIERPHRRARDRPGRRPLAGRAGRQQRVPRTPDLIAIDPLTAAISVRGPSVDRLDAVESLFAS